MVIYVIIEKVIEKVLVKKVNIKKIPNERENCYDFELIDGDKILKILFAGNLDLYMILGNNEIIPFEKNVSLYFDITKEDYEIYSIFDSLYNDIVAGKPFGEDCLSSDYDYKKRDAYKKLVDSNFDINWISDDGPHELEDMLRISKLDGDRYRLTFIRNDKPMDCGFKNHMGISIRFRNSGSLYDPFNCVFMIMYHKLQEIDPEYHQMHIEEIEYLKKKKIKL